MSVYIGKDVAGNVEDYVDKEVQVQAAGVELTLNIIRKFQGNGSLGFGNDKRHLPRTAVVEFDPNGSVWLEQGSYLVDLNETVAIPADKVAIAIPRSSLLRMGVSLGTALWDPGYKGKGQVLLVVHNEYGVTLYKDTRLLQLVYMDLNKESAELYNGQYQHAGL
jgi:dUTP pyrophosphatase